jgi:predicted thioesterase
VDIWEAHAGQHADLGDLAGPPPGLHLAARVLGMVAAAVPPGTLLEQVVWHGPEGTPGTGRLRATLHSRADAIGTLRLHLLDGDRATWLGDLRCRRRPARTAPAGGMLSAPPNPGDATRRDFTVEATMTTDHVAGRAPVLATPALIAMLEDTAADLLRPLFTPGASSVGTWIGVRHTGAAALGEQVTVHAAVAATRGRRVTFDVRASVGHRPIGDGQVTQTLVWA